MNQHAPALSPHAFSPAARHVTAARVRPEGAFTRPARVCQIVRGACEVALDDERESSLRATLAIVPARPMAPGRRVLVAGEGRTAYIIGELDLDAEADDAELRTATGATAAIRRSEGRERIEVRDAQARLVFELDATSGRATLSTPSGDLALRAGGNVEISAGGSLRCDAPRAELRFGETRFEGERVTAVTKEASVTATRLETIATRLFERAKSVFRQVDDLHQLKAGRARTLVAGGLAVKAGHASIRADEELKLDGETIHLG